MVGTDTFMGIFNFFGSIFGYLLWFLYTIFKNYGVAIILFTFILKALMMPLSIKQQKSMASQAKLGEKQKEIQKRCGTDKQKYNEEIAKLYEKENVSPMSGCLLSIIPFPIMLGIYYSVILPLTNTLHIAGDAITKATEYVQRLPGVATMGQYIELDIVKNWDALSGNLSQFFTASDISKIESFTGGFKFLGLDLLKTPQGAGFMDFLWLIPVLCLLSSWAMTFFMNKSTGVKQQGCMKFTMYLLPLISVYWSFIMPAAVGFYWVLSSVTNGVQSVITNKYFSINHMTALNEAQRFVTLQQSEAAIRPLPVTLQKEIADKIEAQNASQNQQQAQQKKGGSGAKKKNNKNNKNSSDYLGKKI